MYKGEDGAYSNIYRSTHIRLYGFRVRKEKLSVTRIVKKTKNFVSLNSINGITITYRRLREAAGVKKKKLTEQYKIQNDRPNTN